MSTSLFKNSDLIKNLPTDDEELSLKEKTILDTIYPYTQPSTELVKNIPKDTEKAWFHFKDIIIATILFTVINLPISEKLLEKIVKTENIYYKLLYKSLTFALLFFLINNFYLSRKNM
jgi:hypothetical protein